MRTQYFLGGLAILGVALVYLWVQMNDQAEKFERHIANAERRVTEIERLSATMQDELRMEVQQKIDSVGNAETIAAELVNVHSSTIAEVLREKISRDVDLRNALRGASGQPADPAEVATVLMETAKDDLAAALAASIYDEIGPAIAYNQDLIDSVAASVYNIYSEELRAKPASAEDIASLLSDSPTFADLVAITLRTRAAILVSP